MAGKSPCSKPRSSFQDTRGRGCVCLDNGSSAPLTFGAAQGLISQAGGSWPAGIVRAPARRLLPRPRQRPWPLHLRGNPRPCAQVSLHQAGLRSQASYPAWPPAVRSSLWPRSCLETGLEAVLVATVSEHRWSPSASQAAGLFLGELRGLRGAAHTPRSCSLHGVGGAGSGLTLRLRRDRISALSPLSPSLGLRGAPELA